MVSVSIKFKIHWEMKVFSWIQIIVGTMREVQVAVDKNGEREEENTSTFSWGKERWERESSQRLGESSVCIEHVRWDRLLAVAMYRKCILEEDRQCAQKHLNGVGIFSD